MSVAGTDLLRVLARLEADETFFMECGREIRAAAGDEAILAFMRVAARHGYRVNFRDAKAAAQHALLMRPVGAPPAQGAPVSRADPEVLSAAVAAYGRDSLKDFLKRW